MQPSTLKKIDAVRVSALFAVQKLRDPLLLRAVSKELRKKIRAEARLAMARVLLTEKIIGPGVHHDWLRPGGEKAPWKNKALTEIFPGFSDRQCVEVLKALESRPDTATIISTLQAPANIWQKLAASRA